MTEPVNQEAPEGFTQRVYNCLMVLRSRLAPSEAVTHTIPLERVTRDELKLLAFIHGVDAVPGNHISFVGTERVVDHVDDAGVIHYVESAQGEYRRLARKYDTIVNSGRGRKYVEECFNTTLMDFGAVIEKVDPIVEMEKRAAEAEAKTAMSEAEQKRQERLRANPQESAVAVGGDVGTRLFGGNRPPGGS